MLSRLNQDPTQKRQSIPISFWENPIGLNYALPATQLNPNEFVSLINYKFNDLGRIVSREGLKKVTTAACGAAIKHIAYIPLGSTNYIFLIDADNKIYKCTGTEPNIDPGAALATLTGTATIIPFNAHAIVLDGSYIKATQGTTVDLAYDNGTGPRGYLYNNTCASNDWSQALYSGAVEYSALQFTTPDWGDGTIPMLGIETWLSKTGSPTGTVYAYLYSTAGDLLDTATTTLDPTSITTSGKKYSFTFEGTYNLASDTAYRAVVRYSGGDASNYVKVHAETEGSGLHWYYDGSWNQDTAHTPLMGVKPGLPPKGSFGDVTNNRLFVSGDPDYPGYVWFGNIGSHLDWSTSNGGGYVGAVDEDANNFPVGGIIAFYGDLYVYGKSSQPYLCKLTGTSPDTYSLPVSFQRIYTIHNTLIGTPTDVWFTSGDNVHNMAGVQEYGDVRTFGPGDPIASIIRTYFDNNAFATYNPYDGQYWLKLNGYSNTLVCHTKHPYQGRTGITRYKWVEYSFQGLTPTAFASFNGYTYVGCSNGHLYRLDSTLEYQDAGATFSLTAQSGFIEIPFTGVNITDLFMELEAAATSSGTLSFYRDGSGTALLNKAVASLARPINHQLNFTCDSIQIKLHTMTFTKNTYLGRVQMLARPMSKYGR